MSFDRPIAAVGRLAFLVFALPACSGEGPDPHYAFEPFAMSTVFTYTGNVPLSATGRLMGGVVDTTEIGGRKMPQWHAVFDATNIDDLIKPGTSAVDLWLDHVGDTMVVGGLSFPNFVTTRVDPPVSVPLNPPVGVPQTFTFPATATMPGSTTSQPVTLSAQATLLQDDASLATPMGTFTGCNHYEANWSISGAGVPSGVSPGPYAAELWYHPDFGLVRANMPELGLSVGLAAEEDYSGSESGYGVIRRMGVIADGNTSFALSSFDKNHKLDADKLTHAKMLLELRWSDDAKAMSSPPPDDKADLGVEFNGGFGYFPHVLVESASSYFFPDEKGFRYNYGYVSQALKNEAGTRGSAYAIHVNQRHSGVAPIRVTARMVYKILSPSQMNEPMPDW